MRSHGDEEAATDTFDRTGQMRPGQLSRTSPQDDICAQHEKFDQHRAHAQDQDLQTYRASWIDELRQESHEENQRFGVCKLHQETAQKSLRVRSRRYRGSFAGALPQKTPGRRLMKRVYERGKTTQEKP